MSDHTEVLPSPAVHNAQLVTTGPDPMRLLAAALEKGTDIDKLGRLFDLAERYEKAQAAVRFAAAITGFQRECPRVKKDRKAAIQGKDGKAGYGYKFANFEDVDRVAAPLLAKYEIVVTFDTEHIANGSTAAIKTICRVRVGTHVEETKLSVPVPQMTVNDTQRYGAALSYAKRYAMCAALKIVVADEDDDGMSLVERVNDEQVQVLRDELKRTGTTEAAFLHWMAAQQMEGVLARDYDKALDFLRRKPDAQPKPQKGATAK